MTGLLFWEGPGRRVRREVEVDSRLCGTDGASPGAFQNGQFHTRRLAKFCYQKIVEMGNRDVLMLDIGAHIGGLTLLAAFRPRLRVVAFEPLPGIFDILQNHIRLNGLEDRVSAFPCAVFDRSGKTVLKVPLEKRNLGSSTLGKPNYAKYREIEVECCRLDDWVWPDPIDLMKIDIEGAELHALRGGTETIQRHRPALLLEFSKACTRQFGYKPRRIQRLLENWGYGHFELIGMNMWVTWR